MIFPGVGKANICVALFFMQHGNCYTDDVVAKAFIFAKLILQ